MHEGVIDKLNRLDEISDSQRYRSLGNGWTVDVIAHVLSGISKEK